MESESLQLQTEIPESTIKLSIADTERVEYWTRELEREIRDYKNWRLKRGLRRAAWIVFLVVMLTRHHVPGFWWMWFVFGGGAAADTAAGNRRKAVSELAETRDPRAAGVLAIAYRDGDSDTRRLARRSLTALLPQLRVSDADFISDNAMNALITLLHRGDTMLLVAVLMGLQQIGDERAIPDVIALRDGVRPPHSIRRLDWPEWRWTGVASWDDVRQAAAECLPYLERNAERRRASSTLLRAVQAPGSSDMALLRPAGTILSEPEDQLLRPAAESGSE